MSNDPQTQMGGLYDVQPLTSTWVPPAKERIDAVLKAVEEHPLVFAMGRPGSAGLVDGLNSRVWDQTRMNMLVAKGRPRRKRWFETLKSGGIVTFANPGWRVCHSLSWTSHEIYRRYVRFTR